MNETTEAPDSGPAPFPGQGEVIRIGIGLAIAVLVAVVGFPIRYAAFWAIYGPTKLQSRKKLAQRTTELMVHGCARPLFLAMAVFAFLDDTFRRTPFTGWDTYLNIVTALFLGHLIGQLIVTSTQFPLCVRHCSGQPIHLLILIIIYTVVLLTGKDAAISILGLMIYFPGLHGNIHSVLKRHANKHGCRINLVARLISMLLFAFLLPTTLLVLLCIYSETVMSMDAILFTMFCITIAYYVVSNFLELRLIVAAIQQRDSGDLGTIEASTDDRLDAGIMQEGSRRGLTSKHHQDSL